MKLPAQDKLAHFAVGICLCLPLLIFLRPVEAFAVTATVGVAKELFDAAHREKHTPDVWDALWTLAGGAYAAFWWQVLLLRP